MIELEKQLLIIYGMVRAAGHAIGPAAGVIAGYDAFAATLQTRLTDVEETLRVIARDIARKVDI